MEINDISEEKEHPDYLKNLFKQVYMEINDISEEKEHPDYYYPVEKGSFAAMNFNNCLPSEC